jgi:hypothetical protein
MRTTEAPVPDLYPMHVGRDSGHPGMSAELFTARYFQHAAHVPGTGRDDPPLDWRLIQDAEANAREIATHARVPGPPAARTPDTRRTRRRGGPGRRIGADGPEPESRNRSRRATAPGNAGPHSNEGLRVTAVRN